MRARFITFSRLPFWFYKILIICIHTCMVVDRCNTKQDKSYLPKADAEQPFTLMDCNMRCRGRESLDLNAFHFIGFLCLASPIVHRSLQYFTILHYTVQYSPPTALRNCNPDKYSQYAAPGKLKRRGFDTNKWFKDEDDTSFWCQEPSLKSWITYR